MSKRSAPPAEPRLVSARVVAARFGVRPAAVYQYAKCRLLPSVRLGRTVRFDMNKIDKLIAEGGRAWEAPCRD